MIGSFQLNKRWLIFLLQNKKKWPDSSRIIAERKLSEVNWESAALSRDEKNHKAQIVYEIKANTYGKSTTSIAQFLYVLENEFGIILDVNLIEVTISDSNYNNTQLALNLINNILGNYTGAITKKKITGLSLYEINILNGLVSSYSYIKRNSPNPTEIKSNALKECIDYYWQTYVNGVLVNEVYLFTDCSQGVEEGGGGSGSYYSTPCSEVDSLAANNSFHMRLDTLKMGWNNNYESGYNYKSNPSGGLNFNYFQGLPASGVDIPTNGSVLGVIHNHNSTEPFSIFSPDDLRRLYQIYYNNQAEPGFAFTLVTDSTKYILKVENPQAFLNFGNFFLQDNIMFGVFSLNTYSSYLLAENQTVALNEQGFLKMVKTLNMGVKLFSYDESNSTWHLKELDSNNNNQVVNSNC